VVRTPLVATIRGGGSRKVWLSDKSVMLDASPSYDPDACNDAVNGCADPDMTFSWVCSTPQTLGVTSVEAVWFDKEELGHLQEESSGSVGSITSDSMPPHELIGRLI
jgi:hypothetical protein